MKTKELLNSNSSTNSDAPQFYLNGVDREQLGILTFAESCKDYWEKIEKGLNRVQSKLIVRKATSKDKEFIVLQSGNSVIGFINGKDVDPAKVAKYLHSDQCVFTRIGEATLEADMEMFG